MSNKNFDLVRSGGSQSGLEKFDSFDHFWNLPKSFRIICVFNGNVGLVGSSYGLVVRFDGFKVSNFT